MIKNNQRHNDELSRMVDTGALDYLIERMEKKLYQEWQSHDGDWNNIHARQMVLRNLKKEIMICIEYKDK